MNKKQNIIGIFILPILLFMPMAILSMDPYNVLHKILTKDELPRLLNTIDFKNPNTSDPRGLQPIIGDFNQNGLPDMAISGIYQLTNRNEKFFILIAEERITHKKYKKLFYEEYDKPVYLHSPGTTGDGDPGNQAFSQSSCLDCNDGFDVYWNKKKKRFIKTKWTIKEKRFQKVVAIPSEQVPNDKVDQALQLVGPLKEVNAYVEKVNKSGGKLRTRVAYDKPNTQEGDRVWVTVFSELGEKENFLGRFLVDLKEKKILKKELN